MKDDRERQEKKLAEEQHCQEEERALEESECQITTTYIEADGDAGNIVSQEHLEGFQERPQHSETYQIDTLWTTSSPISLH